MKSLYIVILLIIILILIIFLFSFSKNKRMNIESFASDDGPTNDQYLYPIKGLQPICAKQGLKPAYMPQVCYVDGQINPYANCMCQDKKGNCKVCYPTIKKDDKNSNIVYNADSEFT
jgi:hypothetical protein